MIKIILGILLLIQKVINSEQSETLTINKPSINRLYDYTGSTKYTFVYTDSTFGQKDSSNKIEYFVVNFNQFIDPVVNPEAGHLEIQVDYDQDQPKVYFDSSKLFMTRGNSKFSEKWLNFNENFFVVPLVGFKTYKFILTVNPTKFSNLDINALQEQINKHPTTTGSANSKILNEVKFVAQIYNSDNVALSENVFYPIYLNNNKNGVILEISQDHIIKNKKLFVEIQSCQKDNLIGSIDVEYYTSQGNSFKREQSFKPDSTFIELDQDDDTKMIMLKITKDFSDEELFLKVRLRSILKSNVKLAEKEFTRLNTVIEDLSQITNGTKLFSDYIDMPVKQLQIGQAYRLSKIGSQDGQTPSDIESAFSFIYASTSLYAPSLNCGYNPQVLKYYVDSLSPEYPLLIAKIQGSFVQLSKQQQKQPESTILDLRTGMNQKLVTLYVKKSESYSSAKYSDMGMYFAASELFGICSNSPYKKWFETVLYYLVGLSVVVLAVYGIWFVGKKKLGDLGEMKFEREAQKQSKGFEMIDSGPANLSTVTEEDEFEDKDFDDFEVDIQVDDELELA